MTTIQALLIFYYLFSVCFMIGFVLTGDGVFDYPWRTVAKILVALIVAPYFFPISFGAAIRSCLENLI